MTDIPTAVLLAGVLDLAPTAAPHPPGPCDALCVPSCVDGGRAEAYPAAPADRTAPAGPVR